MSLLYYILLYFRLVREIVACKYRDCTIIPLIPNNRSRNVLDFLNGLSDIYKKMRRLGMFPFVYLKPDADLSWDLSVFALGKDNLNMLTIRDRYHFMMDCLLNSIKNEVIFYCLALIALLLFLNLMGD